MTNYNNFQLLEKPKGYLPDVETEHRADGTMVQRFRGNRIVLTFDKGNGSCVLTIDRRTVARFADLTIEDWGNILYTLETNYTEFINAA